MKNAKGTWLILLLAAALTAAPWTAAAAGEDEKKAGDEQAASEEKDKAKEKDEGKVHVFTNADLKRYRFRAREGTEGPKTIVADMSGREAPPPPPPDAVDPAQKKRLISELQAEIQAAEKRLDEIAAREASLRNPFLPRPKLSEEDREATQGMDARQQLAVLGSEKKALQEKLPELRKELERVSSLPVKEAAPAAGAPGEGTAPSEPPPPSP